MTKQVFKDGTVLLTGDEMIRSLLSRLNHRGAYDVDCSFCAHEDEDEYCDGCTISNWELSCSCHSDPPCSKCVGSKFEVSPYLINYEAHESKGKHWQCFRAGKDVFDKSVSIEGKGLHLSAEVLSTGEAAMYIEDGVEKDYEIDICTRREFKDKMCEMIMAFDLGAVE